MLQISPKYGIRFSEFGVEVVLIRVNQKTGESYYAPQYYYSNLSQALEGIIDRSLDADITSLELLNDKIEELKADVNSFLEKQASQSALKA